MAGPKGQKKTVFNAKILKELLPLARPLSFFIPDPRNARTHSPANIKAIANSLKLHGQHRPAVSTPDGRLIIGHGMLEAAKSLGWTHLAVLTTNDTDREALSRAILDNRTSDLSDFDIPILKDLLVELDDGLGNLDELTGFSGKELKKLIDWEPKVQDAEPQFDKAEELRKKWGVETGQLWELGDHRLICGDCTDKAIVERVMGGEKADMVFTDPPYGVGYDGGAKKRERLEGDDLGTRIYADSLCNLRGIVQDHATLYLWYADAHAAAAAAAAAAAGFIVTAQIIWIKNNAQFVSSAHYHGKHEPCFYAHLKGKVAQWYGGKNEVTVWECDRANRNEYHPTQKPVPLAIRAITNSSKNDDIVFDGFLGSGTTLIACENLGRKCRAIEISPAYVAVAIQRWADATGKVPKLIPSLGTD